MKKRIKTNKYTYDYCYNIAKDYQSRYELQKANPMVYQVSYKNGWLDKWIPRIISNTNPCDSVYAYFFESTHSVYIGRTLMYRQHSRHLDHCERKNDTVYRYAKDLGVNVPNMVILKENLVIKDGQYYEGYYVDYYRKKGWNILNKNKTGSIGSIGAGFLTYDYCLSIAKKCKTLRDFYKTNQSAYNKAKKKGWIKDYIWFKKLYVKPYIKIKDKPISLDDCYDKAKRCVMSKEFREKYPREYSYSVRNGFLKKFDWLVRKTKWNYEECKKEANKYTSRNQLSNNNRGCFNACKKNGWLNEFFGEPQTYYSQKGLKDFDYNKSGNKRPIVN